MVSTSVPDVGPPGSGSVSVRHGFGSIHHFTDPEQCSVRQLRASVDFRNSLLSHTREEIEKKELEKVLTPALISKLELLRQMEEVAQAGESKREIHVEFVLSKPKVADLCRNSFKTYDVHRVT
jgi:hypothetical protein